MKKLLYLMLLAAISLPALYAQSNASAVINTKAQEAVAVNHYSPAFYFPVSLFSDSNALYKALSLLAGQVLVVYDNYGQKPDTHSNRAGFYDTASFFYMVKQDYPKAIALIDSARKWNEWDPDNKAAGIPYESYARTQKEVQTDNTAFSQAYLKALKDLYNRLSSREKTYANYFLDTIQLNWASHKFYKTIANLKKKNTDSLNLQEAKTLLYQYNSYIVYSTVSPLARPFLKGTPFQVRYPAIKNQWAGVVPVMNIDNLPVPNGKYKLMIELSSGIKDKNDSDNINNVNGMLYGAGRQLNLHLAAGIPRKNIDMVLVVHGFILNSLLNNEAYQKKYHTDNPNIPIVEELQKAGVKFVACGQSMFYMNIKKEELIPGIKVALSAQTALSTYQLKHYVYYNWAERN